MLMRLCGGGVGEGYDTQHGGNTHFTLLQNSFRTLMLVKWRRPGRCVNTVIPDLTTQGVANDRF